MAPKAPPRYVPTLTEVVKGAAPVNATAGAVTQEQLIQRVMQRVDAVLERRLREAIAATVIEQTRELAPALRERIELVVRDTVAEVLAQDSEPDAPVRN